MNHTKLAIAAVLAAVVAAAGAYAALAAPAGGASAAEEPARTIAVSGTASVEVVPDRAVFSFCVENRAASAGAALAANSPAMRRVIAALKALGIADRDLRTENVSVSRDYDDDGNSTGYTASNCVRVTVRKLALAGTVVDAAVDAGADGVEGPMLHPEDVEALYRRALETAVADARAKAEAIARASGLTLGRTLTVDESGDTYPVADAALARKGSAAEAPIEPGTEGVVATVDVTFAAS